MDTAVIDVGGTHTTIRFRSGKKEIRFPTDRDRLPALLKKKLGSHKPEAVVVGMRGVWTPAERKTWHRKLKGLGSRVTVLSDIELAHRLAFGLGPGVVLNAGTGSIAYGRNNKGATTRAGGLGPLLGDDGSAFWIGREYLRSLAAKKGKQIDIRKFSAGESPVRSIAALAVGVIQRAQRGKAVERKIVTEAQHQLLNLARQVRADLGGEPLELSLAGGLFANPYFRAGFLKQLKRR